jgi:hypothetical protein
MVIEKPTKTPSKVNELFRKFAHEETTAPFFNKQ